MNILKATLLSLVLSCSLPYRIDAATKSSSEVTIATFICKQDFFGNTHIDIVPHETTVDGLTKQLNRYIRKQKNKHKNKAFFINIPHAYGMHNQSAKNAGFSMHYANDEKTQWIFRNGSSMPHSSTAVASASIFIFRTHNNKQELLLIKDLDKSHLCLPGGYIDPHELAINAAVRETKEETNLQFKPADMKLVALTEEAHTWFYDRTVYRFFFATTYNDGKIKLDPKEQEFYLWVPVEQLMTGLRIEGYEVEKIIFRTLSAALSNGPCLQQLSIPKQDLSYNILNTTESISLWKIN